MGIGLARHRGRNMDRVADRFKNRDTDTDMVTDTKSGLRMCPCVVSLLIWRSPFP